MTRNPSRIVFSGDGFRSSSGEPDQMGNVASQRNNFGDIFQKIMGVTPEVIIPLGANSVKELYNIQGAEFHSLESWASIFQEMPSDKLVATLSSQYSDSLIVMKEIPPIIEKALNRAGVPWIDISVSPLRFLPDWPIHIKTSPHFNLNEVQEFTLSDNDIKYAVERVSSYYGPSNLPPGSVVFFAQTSRDRTVIKDGRFFSDNDLKNNINNLLINREVFLKTHPWEKNTAITNYLIENGAKLTNEETYSILTTPGIDIVTVSSSVGREAIKFGRTPNILSPVVQDWAFSGIDVMRDSVSLKFWAALLGSAGFEVKGVEEEEPSWRPNLFRGKAPSQGLDDKIWDVGQEINQLSYNQGPELTGGFHNKRRTLMGFWRNLSAMVRK